MEDRALEILVGTNHGGLAVIHGDSIRTISSKQGMPSNSIYCMTEDANGRLWLGTQLGMVPEDPPGSKRFLKNEAFVGEGVHCCGNTKDGLLWYVTPRELVIYDYIHVENDKISPPTYITTIRVNGNLQPQQPDLQLPHELNNCEFDFIGISFRDEQTIRYQYRMIGVDKAWQGPTSQNSVTYASLVPGAYRFEVKASNVYGIESTTPASFSFTIIPPYWQRWWFYLLAFLASGATIVTIFRYRVRKLLELERVRIRIASDLHDDVGSTLTKISLQADQLEKEIKGEDALHMVARIGAMSRDVVNTMSDLVWSIDARNDTVGDLVDRMRDVASGVLSHQEMSMTFDVKGLDEKQRLPVDVRQNLYLIFKEAITNSAKHANASRVSVSLENTSDHFVMEISDDGKSDQRPAQLTGHGLKNMEMRSKRMGGKFETTRENGFTIIITTKPL
jgi:two-component sensor histidine kinase